MNACFRYFPRRAKVALCAGQQKGESMSVKSSFNGMRLGKALDARGVGGETYLTRAVKMQQHDAINDFLDLGCDANVPNAQGESPIFIALSLMDAKAIDTLVLGGASVFVKKDGMTFKEHAKKAGLAQAVERVEIVERERAAYAYAISSRGM